MSRLERLKDAYLRTRRWVPLTDLGVLVLGLGILVFVGYGEPRTDYVVQMVAAAAVGLVALALLVVLIGAWRVRSQALRARAAPEPLGFEARRGFGWGRDAPRVWWLPLIEVTVEVRSPTGLQVIIEDGRERIEAHHRGGSDRLLRTYRIEDSFGLAEVSFERTELRAVKVAPWTGALDRAPALTALAPGENRPHPHGRPEGDRVEMRPYVRGDPLRMVLWKVYARTGALMVRTAERALDEDVEVDAYLITGSNDEASAAAAWVAVTRGLLGPRWRFGADGTPGTTSDVEAATAAIARSRTFGSPSHGGWEAFLDAALRRQGSRVVLFAPCRPGPWLDSVTERARGLRGRISVVIGHDGVETPERSSAWLARPRPQVDDGAPPESELTEVIGAFARLGVDLFVIDRPTGRAGHPHGWRQVA